MMIDDLMVRSDRKVPFSWKNTTGVSKTRNNIRDYGDQEPSSSPVLRTLASPPCPLVCQRKLKLHEIQIPLPPCTFQPPPPDHRSRGSTNPKKGKKNRKSEGDDPFFAAYKECTKVGRNTRKHDVTGGSGTGQKLRNRLMMGFSCKTSTACDVREDKLARIPRFS